MIKPEGLGGDLIGEGSGEYLVFVWGERGQFRMSIGYDGNFYIGHGFSLTDPLDIGGEMIAFVKFMRESGTFDRMRNAMRAHHGSDAKATETREAGGK